MRLLIEFSILAYVLIGAALASIMSDAIPAMNLAGQIYFAATWPFWLNGMPNILPIPSWSFSFA